MDALKWQSGLKLSITLRENYALGHATSNLKLQTLNPKLFSIFVSQKIRTMRPGTKFIHAGVEPDPSTGAIMTPIYQTSTFVQEAPAQHKGYEYARSQNPTRTALENAFAAIENGKYGLAFSSGVAATDAVIKLLQPGDEVIAANDMYGGTYRMFTRIYEKFGIKFHYVNMQNADAIIPYINKNTKLIWTETPTNPLMNITDIEAISSIA